MRDCPPIALLQPKLNLIVQILLMHVLFVPLYTFIFAPFGVQEYVRTPRPKLRTPYPVNEKQSIYYAHVTGTAISESINMLTQKPISVFPVNSNQLFSLVFMQLIEEFLKSRNFKDDTFRPISTVKISALIFQILDMLKPENKDSCDDVIFNSMRYISNHFCEDITLEKCASNCCLSVSRYIHLFKEKIGISPYKLIVSLRIEKAKNLLENTSASVTEISEDVGFADPAYFSRIFKNKNGLSPSEYRKLNSALSSRQCK